jgi:hypothetical protein
VILALLVACKGSDGSGGEGTPWSAIEGTLEVDYTVGGFSVCDGTVSFTGVPYTGECEGCEFAFEIEAVLERDDGTIACPWDPILTLYAPGSFWHAPTVVGLQDQAPDTLLLGVTVGEHETAFATLYDGDYGTVSYDGDQLGWTLDLSLGWSGKLYGGMRYPLGTPCTYDYFAPYDDRGPYGAGNTTYGALVCEYGWTDVFEFEGTEGGVAHITADTTSDDPAVAMVLWVYGPESCVEQMAFGNYECSKGPVPCPAMSIDTQPGRYIAVLSVLACDGDGLGSYRLDLDASWDPGLEQIHNDLFNYGPASYRVDASATLSE